MDQRTLDSAYLLAKARFEDWKAQVEADWGSMQAKTLTGLLDDKLGRLPENVKNASKAVHPQEWADLEKRLSSRR